MKVESSVRHKRRKDKMKRFNNIYENIVTLDNLQKASKRAKRNKNKMKEVNYFLAHQEELILKLQRELKEQTFTTSKYKHYNIVDKGKTREISDLPYYPDRIVHWAIMLQIEHIFLKHFIFDTYAAIPNKGSHLAIKRIRQRIDYDPVGSQYCLQMDIKKFFPSIDQEILKNLMRKKIKDEKLLWLLDNIINSTSSGIPIGNYLSQYFGNYYLSFFDHYCKEVLQLNSYWRYMDDIIILHKSKEHLHQVHKKISLYLKGNLNLTVKDNWQIYPTYKRGIDFIGYRIFRSYSLLRKSTAKNFKRKMRNYSKQEQLTESDMSSISSYKGWLKWCNSHNLYKQYVVPLEYKMERYNESKISA